MAVTQHGVMTLEEFLKLPEQKPALEFEDGRVTQKVSPELPHGVLQLEIGSLFNRALRPDRIGLAFSELRTTFAERSRVPDIAVYRWNRIPRRPEGGLARYPFTPPDVAVEIRSSEQSVASQRRRCRDYVDQGVPLALLVVPEDESVWLFLPNQPEIELRGNATVDFSSVFPGLTLTPAEMFSALHLD